MAQQASLVEIKHYFATPDRPVTAPEMTKFWGSLSAEEKEFYKNGVGEILEAEKK